MLQLLSAPDPTRITTHTRSALARVKLDASHEQCAHYLLRHHFDLQQAVQAFYRDKPPMSPVMQPVQHDLVSYHFFFSWR